MLLLKILHLFFLAALLRAADFLSVWWTKVFSAARALSSWHPTGCAFYQLPAATQKANSACLAIGNAPVCEFVLDGHGDRLGRRGPLNKSPSDGTRHQRRQLGQLGRDASSMSIAFLVPVRRAVVSSPVHGVAHRE
jgi:hypothetical protein